MAAIPAPACAEPACRLVLNGVKPSRASTNRWASLCSAQPTCR